MIWKLITVSLIPFTLAGCGAQGLIAPVLSSGLLGGGGANSTLTLQIDQAHGVLTMGLPATMPPVVGTPMTPVPVPLPVPAPTPVPVPPAPIPAPTPVPTVP